MLSPFTVPALEGTAGPVTLNDPVFISDLHLSHSEPDTINAFLRFLEHEAAEHAELLILGDFFDYWIGDDASYTMAAVADALRAYSASHGLYIMHGNRDFMMGERFAREIGATPPSACCAASASFSPTATSGARSTPTTRRSDAAYAASGGSGSCSGFP